MADILKITTPLISKQMSPAIRQNADPALPFNIQDLARVAGAAAQSEVHKQNTGLLSEGEPASVLLNMLKDPAVTMSFLKNIYILEEIIHLLPAKNETVTEELLQVLDQLLVAPENIAAELQRQAVDNTSFQGHIFDAIRQFLDDIMTQPQFSSLSAQTIGEIKQAVGDLLKAIHSFYNKQDIIQSLSNYFTYLGNALSSSPALAEKLSQLAEQFRQEGALDNFNALKEQANALIKTVENSILFSPKIAQNIAIIQYNFSRFNNNPNLLDDAIRQISQILEREGLQQAFLKNIESLLANPDNEENQGNSQVMNALSKLILEANAGEKNRFLNSDNIEKIIQSLLSSPCHFTPLLHFVLPVQYDELQAFAEMWLDPDGQASELNTMSQEGQIHLLFVLDITGIGLFETELSIAEGTIDLQLRCPPDYVQEFAPISGSLKKQLQGSIFQVGKIKVEPLVRLRSLMEVFKSLPARRLGLDVKA
jgi:hypothetical protein